MRQLSYLSALGFCCSFLAVQTGTSQTYSVTDLGGLPGSIDSMATGIDDAGQVAGWSVLTNPSDFQAYATLYRDGKLKSLGTLGGKFSVAYAISVNPEDARDKDKLDGGAQVTGESDTAAGESHAFLYKDGILRDLGVLPRGTYTYGYAINRFGEVAGFADDGSGKEVAFVSRHGSLVALPPIKPDLGGEAHGINDLGDVTGLSGVTPYLLDAFLYADGKTEDIGRLPGANFADGRAINNAREIVGDSGLLGMPGNHAFVYRKGKMSDLGLLPTGQASIATGINSSGEIVGGADVFVLYPPPITSPPGIYVGHGFLYTKGKMHDLNDMIPANSGWLLGYAVGINDHGQIAGTGTINGEIHGYLLTLDCGKEENLDCEHCKTR